MLQEKGPIGAFLLSELDASISRGVDEAPNDGTEKPVPAQAVGRRTPTEMELLGILASTLETYLLVLPGVARSLSSYLAEHHKVRDVEITLDPSLLGDELQQTGRARIGAVVPHLPDEKGLIALKQIRGILADIGTEGA